MPETLEFRAELKASSTSSPTPSTPIARSSSAVSSPTPPMPSTRRFDALANAEKLEGNTDWKIKLTPDAAAGTLTISDNGLGMSRAEVIENLGTVAQSGTKAFLEAARAANKTSEAPGLIGQFGVGFYSAFMVADRVTVLTRPAGNPSDGTAGYRTGRGPSPLMPPTSRRRHRRHLAPQGRREGVPRSLSCAGSSASSRTFEFPSSWTSRRRPTARRRRRRRRSIAERRSGFATRAR